MLIGLRQQIADWHRRQNALKRGGARISAPLGETDAAPAVLEAVDDRSPDKLFARKWAHTLFDQARSEMHRKWIQPGRGALFEVLQPYLSEPLSAPDGALLARKLEVSGGNVRVMLHRFRREFALAARYAVAATVATAAEVDQELRELGWSLLE